MGAEAKEIGWQTNLESALEQARSQGRHVLLDFSAAPL
jgi:hypothetical protein